MTECDLGVVQSIFFHTCCTHLWEFWAGLGLGHLRGLSCGQAEPDRGNTSLDYWALQMLASARLAFSSGGK